MRQKYAIAVVWQLQTGKCNKNVTVGRGGLFSPGVLACRREDVTFATA